MAFVATNNQTFPKTKIYTPKGMVAMTKIKKYLLGFAMLALCAIAFFVPRGETKVFAEEVSDETDKIVVIFDYNKEDLTPNIDDSITNLSNYRYVVEPGWKASEHTPSRDATKLSYVLNGYTLSWKVNGETVDLNTYVVYDNTTFEAVWTPIEFTINFDYNDSDMYPATRVNYPNSQNEPLTYTVDMGGDVNISYRYKLSRPNYYFVGWFKGDKEYLAINAGSMGSFTLKAKWTPVEYRINYNTSGDNTKNPTSYNVEDGTIELYAPSLKGHIFEGWYLDKKLTVPLSSIDSSLAKDLNIYPKWQLETYKVTYILPNGARAQVECEYGQKADLPSELNKSIFQVVKTDVSRKNIKGDTRIEITLVNIWWVYALGLIAILGIIAIIIVVKKRREKKFNVLRKTYQSNSSKYSKKTRR